MAVFPVHLAAKRGDLICLPADNENDNTESLTVYIDRLPILFCRNVHNLFRPGGGSNIVIMRFLMHE